MNYENLPYSKIYVNKLRGRKIPLRSDMKAMLELQQFKIELEKEQKSKKVILTKQMIDSLTKKKKRGSKNK